MAAGTYKPTTGMDRNISFQMKNSVAIYGGFPNTGNPNMADRNPNQYETILSGDLLGNDNPATLVEDLYDDPNRIDNSYRIFYNPSGLNLDPNAILDGFTITASNTKGASASPWGQGGGMLNSSNSPTVSNCTFTQNSSDSGGGMHNDTSNPTVTNCSFTDNSAQNDGGGMSNYSSNPIINNCTFSGNFLPDDCDGGGGMYHSGSLTMANCTFSDNVVVYAFGGGILNEGDLTITDCNFTNNAAIDGGNGGGIYNRGNLTVTNCNFTNNSAIAGGGIESGGSPTLTNCIFIGNSAVSYGGGIRCGNAHDLVATNCVFSGNHADGNGGGIHTTDTSTILTNCILWNNTAISAGNEMAIANASVINVNYCDIKGGLPAIYDNGAFNTINWGLGNIDTDPLFADADSNDFHLKSQAGRWDPNTQSWLQDANTSLCIDAGNPGSPLGNEPNDPNNVRINMGAYGGTDKASYAPNKWGLLSDLTNDGIVSFEDLAGQLSYWQQSANEQPGDLSRDGAVDLFDFAILSYQWQKEAIWH